jgi:hypothetical protein
MIGCDEFGTSRASDDPISMLGLEPFHPVYAPDRRSDDRRFNPAASGRH